MVEAKSPEKQPPHTYECIACGHRVEADEQPLECPDCGELMHNISKPRI